MFQVTINTLRIVSVLFAYFLLRANLPAYSIYYSYIFFNIIAFGLRQYILRKSTDFDVSILWRHAYLPCLCVVLLSLPVLLIKQFVHPFVLIIIAVTCICVLILFVGFKVNDRHLLKLIIKNRQ